MQNIYNQIMCENKHRGLTPVEDLLGDRKSIVEQKLNSLGYRTKGLSVKQLATLFFALVDILFVVKDDSFYLVTLSGDKLGELHSQGRLLPRNDENNFVKTSNIIFGNTVEVINKYLDKGKFHFIKLVPLEGSECKSFFCQLSTMNPYPSLDKESVYTLTDVNTWYKDIVTNLIRGTCLLNDSIVCSSYMKRINFTCTSGVIFFINNDGSISNIPIWDVTKIEPYSENSSLQKLLSGVCVYKSNHITMNRQILEKYYGIELYQRLESKNIRYKYCLEEILICKEVRDIWYYKNKYRIEEQFMSVNELLKFLLNTTKIGSNKSDLSYCHARKLCPPGQIGDGKKSFYMTVKLNDSELLEIPNYNNIMPKRYGYYAINTTFGYNHVYVMATSEATALTKGKAEFERQFGKTNTDCIALVLVDDNKLIKGKHAYNFNIETQRALCQNIMYGYVQNYQGYVKYIRELYECTNLKVFPSDELIQFLYINKLAKKYKYGSKVEFVDVILYLLDFFELLTSEELAKSKLYEAWSVLSYKQCKREYIKIVNAYPNLNDYLIEDTPNGQYIVTEFGRYRITKNGIATTVSLRYKGVELGNKRIGENK